MWYISLQWHHNERNGVPDHKPHDCLLSRLFRRRSKKTTELSIIGLCAGNSPVKGLVTRKMFPFDDVGMCHLIVVNPYHTKFPHVRFNWIRPWFFLPSLNIIVILTENNSSTPYTFDISRSSITQHPFLVSSYIQMYQNWKLYAPPGTPFISYLDKHNHGVTRVEVVVLNWWFG